jgi:hypothetical protein
MYDPHASPPHRDDFDDIDRLFARLDRAPVPAELTARVLSSTQATRAVLAWPWMIASLAALGILAVAGYQLGASLASSDGLDLLIAVFSDLGLIATAPGDVLAALGEVVPWALVALAALSAALLILASGNLVSRTPAQRAA